MEEEICELPSDLHDILLHPHITYLGSRKAVNEALGFADQIKHQIHKDDNMEQSRYAIVIHDPDRDALLDYNYTKKRRLQPFEKIEDNISKSDKSSKLDDPHICSISDDGGDLLCCDGPCQRKFHAVQGVTGKESYCETLGMTIQEVKDTIKFYCKNCQFQKHQCFVCGELGSSAASPILGHQEVFRCLLSTCRRYYHPECVARALLSIPDWKIVAEKIQRGQRGFHCPRHFCRVCQIEELNPEDLVRFRRCPKSWHLGCLQEYNCSSF